MQIALLLAMTYFFYPAPLFAQDIRPYLRADTASVPERRLKLLTPRIVCPPKTFGNCMLSDPSPPMKDRYGIRLTGTGFVYAQWKSWSDFLRAQNYKYIPLNLFEHVDEKLMPIETDFSIWDISIEPNGVLYGGAITPTPGHLHSIMWDDNWNRRVYAFSKDWKHRWIRNSRPIIVEPVDSFLGHFYGHQFIKDEKGHTYVFYEKVDQLNEQGDFPLKTEIFARKMISPFQSSNDEITILTLGDPIYPSAKRKDDALIEGPRPFKAVIHGKTFYFIGFSSGQYTLNTYGINLAVSKNLLGPYRTYLKADSSDLMDLGINLRKQYQFGQGPGRPAFFQDPQKKWWVLFHASEPSSHDIRHIFLAPVSFAIGQNGIPSVTISDGNLGGAEPFSSGTTLSKTR